MKRGGVLYSSVSEAIMICDCARMYGVGRGALELCEKSEGGRTERAMRKSRLDETDDTCSYMSSLPSVIQPSSV